MAKDHFCNCGKQLSSYHSLWRHRKICKKKQEPRPISIIQPTDKGKIVKDIINKVVRRANMDVEPMTKKAPSSNKLTVVPIEAVNNVKPKSLTLI